MSCPDGIDPRMPRFGQTLTGSLLATAFVLQAPALVAFVALVLAGAAFGGPRWSLWAHLYKRTLARALGPPVELEDPRGPRFANRLGFGFMVVAAPLLLVGPPVAWIGWALALAVSALALLAAVTGFCVACHLYPLVARFGGPATS